MRASKVITSLLKEQRYPENETVNKEIEMIKKEVKTLLYATLNIGKGDLAQGVIKAFEAGLLDIPFAPSEKNLGKILPARDAHGNIRILEFGNLPFEADIKEFHKNCLKERATQEDREVSFQMTIDDVYAVSRGNLVGKPKEVMTP